MTLWKFMKLFDLDLATIDEMVRNKEIELYFRQGKTHIRERK